MFISEKHTLHSTEVNSTYPTNKSSSIILPLDSPRRETDTAEAHLIPAFSLDLARARGASSRIFFPRHIKLDVSAKIRLRETPSITRSVPKLSSYSSKSHIFRRGRTHSRPSNHPSVAKSTFSVKYSPGRHSFHPPIVARRVAGVVASLNSTARTTAELHCEHDSRLRRNDRDVPAAVCTRTGMRDAGEARSLVCKDVSGVLSVRIALAICMRRSRATRG